MTRFRSRLAEIWCTEVVPFIGLRFFEEDSFCIKIHRNKKKKKGKNFKMTLCYHIVSVPIPLNQFIYDTYFENFIWSMYYNTCINRQTLFSLFYLISSFWPWLRVCFYLTSLFLLSDNSIDHMLNALLKSKFLSKKYSNPRVSQKVREIGCPILE